MALASPAAQLVPRATISPLTTAKDVVHALVRGEDTPWFTACGTGWRRVVLFAQRTGQIAGAVLATILTKLVSLITLLANSYDRPPLGGLRINISQPDPLMSAL